MANGDKIKVDLSKLEGSMSGLMNQMGLGIDVKGGGSKKGVEGDGGKGRDKTVKKETKSGGARKDAGKNTGQKAGGGGIPIGKQPPTPPKKKP